MLKTVHGSRYTEDTNDGELLRQMGQAGDLGLVTNGGLTPIVLH
jgi:hypothetical protein